MFANTDLIDAVAQRRFSTLGHLEPVWDATYDEPWYSTGKMGIVFKLKDPISGQLYALKVFKERDAQKEERLLATAEQISVYPSPYWTSYQFIADELRIESLFSDEIACVLLMEWIEGRTLGQYIKECCNASNRAGLYKLAYAFDQMALWLLANPFAHGDLKHDNIIITPKGTPVLVDYDGVYFPVFEGQQAFELGTPDYQHPQRGPQHYGPYLDDFSILVISLSLYALAQEPQLYSQYNNGENLILTLYDFTSARDSELMTRLQQMSSPDVKQRFAFLDYVLQLPLQSLLGLEVLLKDKRLYYQFIKSLIPLKLPKLIPCNIGNKWGFINCNNEVVVPYIYDDAFDFSEGLAIVMQGSKYGYINEAGKLVVPCIYDDAFDFSEGLAIVMQGSKYGYIDKTGKLVVPYIYDHALNFSEGLAIVMQGSKYGYIDKTGKLVVPYIYDDAFDFSEGLAKVKQGSKYGYIDKAGKLVIPCIYGDNGDDDLPF